MAQHEPGLGGVLWSVLFMVYMFVWVCLGFLLLGEARLGDLLEESKIMAVILMAAPPSVAAALTVNYINSKSGN